MANERARNAKVNEGETHIALVGRDAHDVRAFMVEGESGILAQSQPDFMPEYFPSKRMLRYPNGVEAHIYYAEEPKGVRGPNHFFAWCDEPASWQDAYLGIAEDTTWSNLMFTMRKGDPHVVVSGTPKPVKLIRQMMKLRGTITTRGSTFDNAGNLAKTFFDIVIEKYDGTRLGQQEIYGEILDDNPAALWKRETIEAKRMKPQDFDFEGMDKIVVAVDPQAAGVIEDAISETTVEAKSGAETGIIICGKKKDRYFIIDDKSVKGQPGVWAKAVTDAFKQYLGDAIVAEKNNGGEMVRAVITASDEGNDVIAMSVELVWASKNKTTRAEPVATLYERGKVHHVGNFLELEDQMCEWDPTNKDSPDRMDAMVWGITYLMEDDQTLREGSKEDHDDFFVRKTEDN